MFYLFNVQGTPKPRQHMEQAESEHTGETNVQSSEFLCIFQKGFLSIICLYNICVNTIFWQFGNIFVNTLSDSSVYFYWCQNESSSVQEMHVCPSALLHPLNFLWRVALCGSLRGCLLFTVSSFVQVQSKKVVPLTLCKIDIFSAQHTWCWR